MFKNRKIEMRVVKDKAGSEPTIIPIPNYYSWRQINEAAERHTKNLALVVCGVIVVIKLSSTLHDLAVIRANSARDLAYAVEQAKLYATAAVK